MDQTALVSDQVERGRQLLERLARSGFEVQIAFWAKPTADGKWFLYVASPFVDEKGLREGNRFALAVVRSSPELGIEPLDVKVLGTRDSLTEAALAVRKPHIPDSPFAVRRAKPYSGIIQYGWGGATLGGLDIDGACIYPPRQPHQVK